MPSKYLLCFLLLCAPLALPAATAPRALSIDDLLTLERAAEPRLSPEGDWVAYTVRSIDRDEDEANTRIWMAPLAGGEPVPMTAPDTGASDPRWSPDGRYLSFKAAKGEKARAQVWNLDRRGGEAQQVTELRQGIQDYAWSPDGKRLLLLIRDPRPEELTEDEEDDDEPRPHVIDRIQFKRDYTGYLDRRRTHLYVYTPGEAAPRQITFGDYDDADPVWSPDGQQVAFVSDRSEEPDLSYNTDIWIVEVDAEKPEPRRLTANPGRDFSPAWSPDGRSIAYVTSSGPDVGGSALTPTRYLARTAVDADERRLLTGELDRNVSNPRFAADGQRIYFELEDAGRRHLASVRLDGDGLQRVLDGRLTLRDFDLQGERLVALLETAERPGEIHAVEESGLRPLTDLNGERLAGVALAGVEKLAFQSADGTTVEAFFVKPVAFREGERYPTILWLHGGPASQFSFEFSEVAQLFAARGYGVIMPNVRGSTGYGEDFAKATVAAWGGKDFEDAMAAVDHGIELGWVDPERLGVGGWSYGGILTNYVITRTDRFAAAMSGASLGLVTANYGHDQYQLMYELEFGLPWENPELWTELSPFSKVEAITTPTLWMGGAVDWNVPIINSEQMYLAMKRLGRETRLVVYPDEHHGIRRPSFVADRYRRWLDWFDAYLKPGAGRRGPARPLL